MRVIFKQPRKGAPTLSVATTSPGSHQNLVEPATPGRQYLNAADRLMFVAHKGLRSLGHPGFQCQTHVWLRGRVDVHALREALALLQQRYPVVTSRSVIPDRQEGPYWEFQPDADVELHEAALEGSDESAVHGYAEKIYVRPIDHDRVDPISFHLLHLPDGRDVFLLRFGHSLMDGKAPEFVLQEINRFHAQGGENSTAIKPNGADHEPDELAAYLDRFDRKQRVRAALRVIRSHIRLPSRLMSLDPPDLSDLLFEPFRIAVRSLDEAQTEVVTKRTRQLCGFMNMSPVVLASAFRAISRLTQRRQNKRTCFQTDVPLNLRPPGRFEPIFHNFMSFIQLRATGAELGHRDELTQALNSRMRDQLRRGMELGNLQMMTVMSRYERLLAKHIKERMKKHPFTLAFGYQGPAVSGLEIFCGQEVDRLYTLNTGMSPPGITLQVNQFRGRLNLSVSYVSSGVPEALTNAFLDTMIEDLLD